MTAAASARLLPSPSRALPLAAALALVLAAAPARSETAALAAVHDACATDNLTHADRVARLAAAGAQPLPAEAVPAQAPMLVAAFVLQQAAGSGKTGAEAMAGAWSKAEAQVADLISAPAEPGLLAFDWLALPGIALRIETAGASVSRTVCFAGLDPAPAEADLAAVFGAPEADTATAFGRVLAFPRPAAGAKVKSFAVFPDPAALDGLAAALPPPAALRIGGARSVPLAETP